NFYLEQITSCSNEKLPTYIFLSGRDCIINADLVRDYLINNHIDYYWAPNLSHGSFIHDNNSWKKICEWIS
ncbi:unnamed protein product, partial [Rotaria sp. Silwood2]